ncbi:MAG: hypothetical protein AVDCRST_MAG07-1817, partial [uncultured Frankineae bacterium]
DHRPGPPVAARGRPRPVPARRLRRARAGLEQRRGGRAQRRARPSRAGRAGSGGRQRGRAGGVRGAGAGRDAVRALPAQAVVGVRDGDAPSAHRRGPGRAPLPGREVHAVDGVREVRGQARSGLAPGRAVHPDPGPVAHGRLDRARRRHRAQRLPVGAAGIAPAGGALPPAGAAGRALRLLPGGSPLPLPRRGRRRLGGGGGRRRAVRRLPPAPLPAQHRGARAAAGARAPLHERRLAAPVGPAGGRADRDDGLPRRRARRRDGPVRLVADRRPVARRGASRRPRRVRATGGVV